MNIKKIDNLNTEDTFSLNILMKYIPFAFFSEFQHRRGQFQNRFPLIKPYRALSKVCYSSVSFEIILASMLIAKLCTKMPITDTGILN